ncbi:MAG: heme exporter protein CcmB [Leptospiraceae bacterium]|nr:heme exporter protein CcmB [Leptospiraceae bacterium]MCP5497865.1 heme exporter protein CcmB [Leptospiraceae bacterium]
MQLLKALILKEFLLIGRTKNGILSTIVLMLAFIFIFHYSLEKGFSLPLQLLIGLKWSTVFILSFVFIGQSVWEERESGAHQINQLFVPGYLTFLIKSMVICIGILFLEIIMLFLFVIFFESFSISAQGFLGHLTFLVPSTLSLSFLGVALSRISFSTRLKEIVLPMLLIPLSLPIFLVGMEAERKFFFTEQNTLNNFFLLCALSIFYGSIGSFLQELLPE